MKHVFKMLRALLYWKCSESYHWLFTFDDINLVGPSATFSIKGASCRFSILVKSLCCCSAGCTPPTSLNCKHVVAFPHCSHGALGDGILSRAIRSIQNRIRSFQALDCPLGRVFIAANSFKAWKNTTFIFRRYSSCILQLHKAQLKNRKKQLQQGLKRTVKKFLKV